MAGDLTERLNTIHAEAIEDIRGNLINSSDHDLELLTVGNWGGITKHVAEQILAERKTTGANNGG
jgi:hypothetical protein